MYAVITFIVNFHDYFRRNEKITGAFEIKIIFLSYFFFLFIIFLSFLFFVLFFVLFLLYLHRCYGGAAVSGKLRSSAE